MMVIKNIKNRKETPKKSFQVLPNNRIGNEVKQIVRSFNLPLRILLCAKYNVHNNHIYPNHNKWLLLLSFCRMVFLNFMCFYRMYTSLSSGVYARVINAIGSEDFVFVIVLIIFTIGHTFCFTMLFILDIVHKNNNVTLILKIQTIHKSIDFTKSFLSYLIWNWISIFIAISADMFVIVGYYSSVRGMTTIFLFLSIYSDFSFFAFDVNLIIATRVIVLLRKYLEAWIHDVLKMNEEQNNDERCHQLRELFQNILETYSLYKTVFEVLVSHHFI